MENIKVSVIVTVHNAQKYIQECLESVLQQTFSNIEILCMDGGSTDFTPEILQDYAEKDKRIRIINDPDTSYGHKVNRGISEAKGEYISVLESDDMYEPFMIETLYDIMEQYHPDFVNANYTSFFYINGKRFSRVTKMYREEDYNCIINYKKHPERFGIIPRYWTGLFQKAYLEREQIKMNESPGASYQDMSFRFLTSVLSAKAYHINKSVYLYRIDNPASSMHDERKTIVIAKEHEFLKRELLKRNITNRYIWHNAYQWKYVDFRGNMRHLKGKYRQELFECYLEELKKDRDLLETYSDLGYVQTALEMIRESPEKVLELIEHDAFVEKEQRERFYHFWDRITRIAENKKIIVFGCGNRGKAVLEQIKSADIQICCLTDNEKSLWNTDKWGYSVLSPEDVMKQYPDAFFIVANKFHVDDIIRQLRDMGVSRDMICIYETV